MEYPPIELKVWGDFACFTRPELKVERVSYEVMTPSAARGVLEAIFWKPQFSWRIREIRVLKPVRFFSIRRNEVNARAALRTVQQWAQTETDTDGHYYADEDRAQRHTLALRDVAYLIAADVALKPGAEDDPAKFRDQFRRRAGRGQCHSMPYLGCREFTASFELPDGSERPIDRSVDLGRMLFDLDYASDGSGRGQPRFFAARLERGILSVPPSLYERER
ncbi:MAG TPA: type I-C CRISPR-associated protein Cas5c [Ktedonobacterales bacterium]